jgi:alpha 1,3-glucosidase
MGRLTLILTHAPLRAVFLRDGEEQVVLNDQSLLHMEHFRPRPAVFPTPKAEPAADGEEAAVPQLVLQKKRALLEAGHTETHAEFWASFEQEDAGEWQETWSGKPDSKPRGPEALSLDISFPNKAFAFGLPEHASPLNLRDTHGRKEGDFSDPYRLMNTDVFEYEHDSPMSLYGSVPVLHAQGANGAASVFWLNAAETWIDIERVEGSTQTHFFSESGILDLVVFLAPTPAQNMAHFTRLVGRTVLPQYFAMGYHQSRWNYLTTQDVLDVSHAFSEQDVGPTRREDNIDES